MLFGFGNNRGNIFLLFHRTTNEAKKYRSHLEVPGSSKAQRGLFNDQNTKTAFAQPVPVVKKKKTTILKAVVSSLVNRRQVCNTKRKLDSVAVFTILRISFSVHTEQETQIEEQF